MRDRSERRVRVLRCSEPQLAGRPGRKWWRVRYTLLVCGEKRRGSKYLGAAEGGNPLTRDEARQLVLSVLHEVVEEAIDRLVPTPVGEVDTPSRTASPPVVVNQPAVPTLDDVIASYMQRGCQRLRASTIKTLGETTRYMRAFFGPETRLDQITSQAVDAWFDAMVTGEFARQLEEFEGRPNKCKRDGLSDATIKPHIANARNIFLSAMKRCPNALRSNPFDQIKIRVQPKKGDWRYVPAEHVIQVMNAFTDNDRTSYVGWQVLLALCRFAGLRKGEAFDLRKDDIDLDAKPPVIRVYSQKTARQTGNPSRIVPVLYQTLTEKLQQALAAEPHDPFVVSSQLPRSSGSDHKTLHRAFKRAGISWKPAFQVLRACCERDMLKAGIPERLYTDAMGHSPEVSRKHYLARFVDADIDEDDRREYLEAAKKLDRGGG